MVAEVIDVAQGLVEQHRDMGVMQGVDRLASAARADHEIEVAQDP
jgi:hypothetical protein